MIRVQKPFRAIYAFDVDRTLAYPDESRDLTSYLPIPDIVNLAISFQRAPDSGVVVTTARPESARRETEEWSQINGILPLVVLMRGKGDQRDDKFVRIDQINRVKDLFQCEVFLYDDKITNCQAVELETGTPCVLVNAY